MTYRTILLRLKKQLGTISQNDQYHFELLLDSWRTYLVAGEDIHQNGITISSGQRLFVNPAVAVRNEAHKQIKKLSEQFGIVPASRDLSKSSDDDMEALISG